MKKITAKLVTIYVTQVLRIRVGTRYTALAILPDGTMDGSINFKDLTLSEAKEIFEAAAKAI